MEKNNQFHKMRLKELKENIDKNFVANIETMEFMKINFKSKSGEEIQARVICGAGDGFWLDLSNEEFLYCLREWQEDDECYSADVEKEVKLQVFEHLRKL